MYVRLLEDPDLVVQNDAVCELLLQTAWDSDALAPEEIGEVRDRLADLMQVPLTFELPVVQSTQRVQQPNKDEFASYASLVNGSS